MSLFNYFFSNRRDARVSIFGRYKGSAGGGSGGGVIKRIEVDGEQRVIRWGGLGRDQLGKALCNLHTEGFILQLLQMMSQPDLSSKGPSGFLRISWIGSCLGLESFLLSPFQP